MKRAKDTNRDVISNKVPAIFEKLMLSLLDDLFSVRQTTRDPDSRSSYLSSFFSGCGMQTLSKIDGPPS